VKVTTKVESEAVVRRLQAQRRAMGQDVKRLGKNAAEARVLPTARAAAPGTRIAATLFVRSTTRRVYLSTRARGQLRRVVGLLEFGGTVRTPIVPRKAQALHFGGRFASRVTTPRHYRARAFMRGAVHLRQGAFSAELEKELTRVMKSRIEYGRTF